jgi:hypothetical protein
VTALRSAHAIDVQGVSVDEEHDGVRSDEEQVLGRAGRNGHALGGESLDGSGHGELSFRREAVPIFERARRPENVEVPRHPPRRWRSASCAVTCACGIPGPMAAIRARVPGVGAMSAASSGVSGSPRIFFRSAATSGCSGQPAAFHASTAARCSAVSGSNSSCLRAGSLMRQAYPHPVRTSKSAAPSRRGALRLNSRVLLSAAVRLAGPPHRPAPPPPQNRQVEAGRDHVLVDDLVRPRPLTPSELEWLRREGAEFQAEYAAFRARVGHAVGARAGRSRG